MLTLNEEPVVDHSLDVGIEQPGDVMAHLQVGDVNERASRSSERLLAQNAHDQLPVFHDDLFRTT